MTPDAVEAGRKAFESRAWADAFDILTEEAGAQTLEGGDLELLAIAAYLSGHDLESTDAWALAHRARLDADELEGAVRCAFWLGYGLIVGGETARGGGWMARARALVDEYQLDCAESGYLLLPEALVALGRGEAARAEELFEEALVVARRFGDADLGALGILGCGQAQIELGRIADGVGLFDQAMVSVLAGEVSPMVAGIVYCAVINECQGAFDVRRAREWTAALDRWCDTQPGLVPYRGQCRVHRSQILQLHGSWPEAFEEAMRARERLAEPPQPAIGMAHYQLGEIFRLRGEFEEAEEAFERAGEHGRSPEPGLSLLRLAQHRVDGASASIERSLAEVPEGSMRARLLPAYVEIMLEAKFLDKAREASDELFEVAQDAGLPFLAATAAHCRGAVLLAEGEPTAALRPLREAWQIWQELEAPYEAAKTRIVIAAACQEIGDRDGAEREYHNACRVFEHLDATPDLERAAAAFADDRINGDELVTPREHEVLRHLAEGKTNREIALALVISEKTVERHISNIFTKFGVSNRTAATAYAHAHDLI